MDPDVTISLRAELARVTAERNRYRDAITAHHGGKPIAPLAELDEAREQLGRVTDERDRLGAEVERITALNQCHDEALGETLERLDSLTAERDGYEKERDELLKYQFELGSLRISYNALQASHANLERQRDLIRELEAAASLHWITEEELKQSRARVKGGTND